MMDVSFSSEPYNVLVVKKQCEEGKHLRRAARDELVVAGHQRSRVRLAIRMSYAAWCEVNEPDAMRNPKVCHKIRAS